MFMERCSLPAATNILFGMLQVKIGLFIVAVVVTTMLCSCQTPVDSTPSPSSSPVSQRDWQSLYDAAWSDVGHLNYVGAEEKAQQALKVARPVGEDRQVPKTYHLLAMIYAGSGQWSKAEPVLRNGIKACGADESRTLASLQALLGQTLLELNRKTEGFQSLKTSVEIEERLKGTDSPQRLARKYTSAALMFHQFGDADEARAHCDKALQLWKHPPKNEPSYEAALRFKQELGKSQDS